MENNKSYLQRIHLAAFIAIGGYLLNWLLIRNESRIVPVRYISDTIALSSIVFSFAALGAVTTKWKEAAIAALLSFAIYAITRWIIYPQTYSRTFMILVFFLRALPMFLFVWLQNRNGSKLPVIYILCFVAGSAFGFGQYGHPVFGYERSIGLGQNLKLRDYIQFAYAIGAFVAHVIFICELINFSNGKARIGNSRLINLGNIYTKPNSLLTFLCIKSALWYLISMCSFNFYRFMEIFQADADYSSGFESISAADLDTFYYTIAGITILSYIIAGLLLAWYLRKFLLEVFITFDIRSKFVYWLCFLPFIGFIFLLFATGNNKQQKLYIEKRSSLTRFADSSPSSVTTVFLVLLGLRLITTLGDTDTLSMVSLLVTGCLFLWMAGNKNGFYVYLSVNLFLLGLAIVMMYFSKESPGSIALLTGMVLLGTIQLIFVFPIFHFVEFEYMPAEEPVEESISDNGEFHLFPAMK